jgi:hypothetical protein
MAHARARGMTCSVAAQVTEWPKEFQAFFPGSAEIRQAGQLTFGRAEGQPVDDAAMVELARVAWDEAATAESVTRDQPSARSRCRTRHLGRGSGTPACGPTRSR